MKSLVMVIGDVHGRWSEVNDLVNDFRPGTVISCGDWGFWPKFHNTRSITVDPPSRMKTSEKVEFFLKRPRWRMYGELKLQGAEVMFVDGNHEDHISLKSLVDGRVEEGVRHRRRGETEVLPDGRTVMFFGGAMSVDKDSRTEGHTVFAELETPSWKDVDNAMSFSGRVDVLISHTCPRSVIDYLRGPETDPRKVNDPTTFALQMLFEKFRPKLWIFGHWHFSTKFVSDGCEFESLTMAGIGQRWHRWI